MKLSEEIEAMAWAFGDAHRTGEAQRLARSVGMMELELERLRAMEQQLQQPNPVLGTGLNAERDND